MAREVSVQDLQEYELFRGLSAEEKKALVQFCRWESYDAEETILAEGTKANTFYVIAEGRVALEMKVQFGAQAISRQATTEILRAGQYLGWSTLVPPYIYTSSAVCVEPARLIAIDGEKLRQMIDENYHLGYRFLRVITSIVATRLIRTRNTLVHALSILSHDLKAPLVAVQSYLEVIAGGFAGDVNDEQREMLQRSGQRIEELLNLISDILDVSRIETGRLEQEFKPVSLVAVAEKSLADVQGAAQAKSISLVFEAPQGEAGMVGAPGRLQQVLNNLLSNAIKFTPAGGSVTLCIQDGGPSWQVEVSDTGIGIPPEDLPFIFHDFFRGRNIEEKGAGLGLAIARKIVAAHNGKIWVESPCKESGRGTRFTCTLPKDLKPYTPKAKEEAKA